MDTDARPLAALLTSREMARVAREHARTYPRDVTRTRADYARELRIVAAEMYPAKGIRL